MIITPSRQASTSYSGNNSPTLHRGSLKSQKSQQAQENQKLKSQQTQSVSTFSTFTTKNETQKIKQQTQLFIRTSVNFRKQHKVIDCKQKKFLKPNLFTSNSKNQLDDDEKDLKLEKDLKKKLDQSQDMIVEDTLQKDIVGDNVVEGFYQHYKKLDRVIEQNRLTQTEESAYTAMLSKSQSNFLLPSKLGLIKNYGDENAVRINNYRYGDKYIDMLSEGLKLCDRIQLFQLSNNRISDQGAKSLLTQICKNAKIINISNNNIGKLGCEYLFQALSTNKTYIEELNVENNNLGDQSVKLLLKSLETNRTLKRLNLSKNYLSNLISENLKEVLQKNSYLQELYLHWNILKSETGKAIFEALQVENQTLRVLDLSWNSIGLSDDKRDIKESCAQIIADCLKQNENIIHVDLSVNNFTLKESMIISQGLSLNQTIYGFHFYGNYGYIDNKGFLVVDEQSTKDLQVIHQLKPRIEGVQCQKFKRKQGEHLKDCCWICEGWRPHQFIWTPKVTGEANKRPIFIHLDFQGYNISYLGKKKPDTKDFRYQRMLPPGQMIYFFTAQGDQVEAKDQDTIDITDDKIYGLNFYGNFIDIQIKTRNVMDIEQKINVVDHNYIATIDIKPRTFDEVYNPPKNKPIKKKWTFPISIFASYQKDDEELLRKCFEADWSNNKISKIIKDETDLNNTKELLWQFYRQYKDVYKYYAAWNPIGRVYAIQRFAFDEFIKSTQVVDGVLITQERLTLKWEATRVGKVKTSEFSPDRGLVRHQLMEAMVRIAEEKYKQQGKCETYFEATKILIYDHCVLEFEKEKYHCQRWRDKYYWNEECDTVLKFYKNPLDNIFKKYYGGEAKPGQPKFMSLDELHRVAKEAGLYEMEQNFQERDVFISYNQAMQTQIDELVNKKFIEMNFVEFLEAITRMADKFSPAPYGSTEQNIPYEKRYQQPLWVKLESFCFILFNKLADFNIKQTFKVPAESFFAAKVDDQDYVDSEVD